MKWAVIIFVVCTCLLINSVSAGTITDKLALSATHSAKAETVAKEVAAVMQTGEITASVRTPHAPQTVKINIIDFSYDSSGMLKLNWQAWVDGEERQIINPYFIYNPPYTVGNGKYLQKTNTITGEKHQVQLSEENPKRAIEQALIEIARNQPPGKA